MYTIDMPEGKGKEDKVKNRREREGDREGGREREREREIIEDSRE
jgi:hypothetical protein